MSDRTLTQVDQNEFLRLRLAQTMKSREAHRAALQTLTSFRSAPQASRFRHLLNVVVGAAYGWLLHVTAPSLPWSLCLVSGVGFFVALSAYGECIALRKRLDAAIALLLEKPPGEQR